MTRHKILNTIGIQNAITIGLLILGFAANYYMLNTKVSAIALGLQAETEARMLEDKRLNEKTDKIEESIEEGFDGVKNSIEKLDTTMTFHIGWHSGVEK